MKKIKPGMAISCDNLEEYRDLLIQLRDMGYPIRHAMEHGYAKDNAYVIPVCVKQNGISCFKMEFLKRLRENAFEMVRYTDLEEMNESEYDKQKYPSGSVFFPKVENIEILKNLMEKYGESRWADLAASDMCNLALTIMEYERELLRHNPDRCEENRMLIYEKTADVIIGLTQILMMYGGETEIQTAINKKIRGMQSEFEYA